MLKVLIVDDEVSNCEDIKTILDKNCSSAKIEGIATQADQAISLIKGIEPDLIFLDISMPQKNGFELLELFQLRAFEVIFITGYRQYAVEAFRAGAIDYIVKPFSEFEIVNAFVKAENRIKERVFSHQIVYHQKSILPLQTSEGLEFVETEAIMYCDASESYTWFYLHDQNKILVSGNLHFYEQLLEMHGFHRIHRSHLVNILHIKKYVKGRGGYVIMRDGRQIEVSARKKADFFDKMFRDGSTRS